MCALHSVAFLLVRPFHHQGRRSPLLPDADLRVVVSRRGRYGEPLVTFATASKDPEVLFPEVARDEDRAYRKLDKLLAGENMRSALEEKMLAEAEMERRKADQDTSQEVLLPPPPDPLHLTWDALLLAKGFPFDVSEMEVRDWFRPFKLAPDGVVFINDQHGDFSGDAYIRFGSPKQRDRAYERLNYGDMGHRYIQLFKANPVEYQQYYDTKFKPTGRLRNAVKPELVEIPESEWVPRFDFADYDDLQTGTTLQGEIKHVEQYGAFIDCRVVRRDATGRLHLVTGLLHRKDLPRNIGLATQEPEYQAVRDLILAPGMKVRVMVATVDRDQQRFWLTLDASTTEEKLEWFKKVREERRRSFEAMQEQRIKNLREIRDIAEKEMVSMKPADAATLRAALDAAESSGGTNASNLKQLLNQYLGDIARAYEEEEFNERVDELRELQMQQRQDDLDMRETDRQLHQQQEDADVVDAMAVFSKEPKDRRRWLGGADESGDDRAMREFFMFDDMPVAAEPQFTVYSTEQIMNMDLDQIKRELDLRGIPYPPKKTREALEERLLQAVMADTAGTSLENRPRSRKGMKRVLVGREEMIELIMANIDFLPRKGVQRRDLERADDLELEQLVEECMEGLRLWDPPRQQKEQIILDNWDMLQLDNIKQTDLARISDNMMQIMWYDLLDALIRPVYGEDDDDMDAIDATQPLLTVDEEEPQQNDEEIDEADLSLDEWEDDWPEPQDSSSSREIVSTLSREELIDIILQNAPLMAPEERPTKEALESQPDEALIGIVEELLTALREDWQPSVGEMRELLVQNRDILPVQLTVKQIQQGSESEVQEWFQLLVGSEEEAAQPA
ncbi:unnamed protein product [Vitrella brassicaformis CCMP3155]|uniref:S1 motif domain-containing protein n=1 Tax=Vitrella brassicaformis (strain CCMP3155) TaxID=1169540 RepID=A0A0G4GKN4_VITBC|nr:unnamed protein product [Vitrella brassicaformis CCMP3155]|eukprot:CEM30589.1 unnamed protein product [Vitrella brassicaformis CCMP3155]